MPTTAAEAIRALRARAEGDCLIGDRRQRVRFVIDRRRGGLLLGEVGELTDATEAQLLIPDESDPAVALLLSLEPTDAPPGDAEIRFEVYHGSGRARGWALARVEALRYHGEPFDEEELVLTDGIIADEPALCRALNSDVSRVRAMCSEHAGAQVEEPVVVGVDPDGIDVRARFGIVRVPFPTRANTIEEVSAQIERLLGEPA